MRSLEHEIQAVLGRRLNPRSSAPVAVAVSGGGDSVALLALAAPWAARRGRPLLVLTVDHGVQRESAGWCEGVAELAERFGAACSVLRWTGPKPVAGLPAAARSARHTLLADAAREAGAAVVLLGHTADDVAEGERMRAEGSTLGALREWGPSPAWPEGRGVFLLRPLLGRRRAELRSWLAEHGLTWVEDPANADLRYARPRARLAGSALPSAKGGGEPPGPDPQRWAVTIDGRIEAERSLFRQPGGARFAAAAGACASGGPGRVRSTRLAALMDRLAGREDFTAQLGGARVEAQADVVRFSREAGEAARGGLAAVSIPADGSAVWDGRFELFSRGGPVTVTALKGRAAALSQTERGALKLLPAAARPALPVVLAPTCAVSCPLLAPGPVAARALAGDRLGAALGRVLREP